MNSNVDISANPTTDTLKYETSAIHALQQHNIPYKLYEYPSENGPVSAMDVAAYMGFSTEQLFKTLVTTDHHGGYYVFCLPAEARIDMKKAALLVGARKLTMLDPSIFEELTGYVHGGCSPFGLKTELPICVDESAFSKDSIYVSGGRIGLSVEINPQVLKDILKVAVGSFTK